MLFSDLHLRYSAAQLMVAPMSARPSDNDKGEAKKPTLLHQDGWMAILGN